MQLQQSTSETLLLGNHCLLCNLARLLDGVFDSTVYLLDFRSFNCDQPFGLQCEGAGETSMARLFL